MGLILSTAARGIILLGFLGAYILGLLQIETCDVALIHDI